MEDVDTPRVIDGAADDILRTLESHGLEWDGELLWQSRRTSAYENALAQLRRQGRIYACACSRKEIDGAYPGTCRDRAVVAGPHALRLRLAEVPIRFTDRWQGPQEFAAATLGDPVIRRRDALFAYQLAVVVDDAHQRVTDVVRGSDLLDSTPWQLALFEALGLPAPRFAHAPVVTEPDGQKLAKSRRSIAVGTGPAGANLHLALHLLGQSPPPALQQAPPREILAWAVPNWRSQVLKNRTKVALQKGLGSDGPLVIR